MPQKRVKKASAVIRKPTTWYSRWESLLAETVLALMMVSRSESDDGPSFFLLLPATLRWRSVPCGVDDAAMLGKGGLPAADKWSSGEGRDGLMAKGDKREEKKRLKVVKERRRKAKEKRKIR